MNFRGFGCSASIHWSFPLNCAGFASVGTPLWHSQPTQFPWKHMTQAKVGKDHIPSPGQTGLLQEYWGWDDCSGTGLKSGRMQVQETHEGVWTALSGECKWEMEKGIGVRGHGFSHAYLWTILFVSPRVSNSAAGSAGWVMATLDTYQLNVIQGRRMFFSFIKKKQTRAAHLPHSLHGWDPWKPGSRKPGHKSIEAALVRFDAET